MPNINCHINVDNMAELMAKADLAIGAGGSTTWERACLGLPAIVFILAKNQEATSFDMHKRSFFVFADKAEKINKQKLFDIIKNVFDNSEKNKKLIKKNMKLVDGKGTKKVALIVNSVV